MFWDAMGGAGLWSQVADMRAALLRYERLVSSIKAQLLTEHEVSRNAFARYERTIGRLQAELELLRQRH